MRYRCCKTVSLTIVLILLLASMRSSVCVPIGILIATDES